MRKFISLTLAVLLVVAALCGCAQNNPPQSGGLAVKDRAGFEIVIPGEISSIVSMAPAITQILNDLGLGDKIAAMDTQSALLPGVNADAPAFDMLNPDIESIASLRPGIVFASNMSMMGNEANDPFAPLKNLGICVAYIPTSESVAEIKEDLRFIASATGREESGKRLIAGMETEITEIANLKDASAPDKTAYFEISAAPAMYSFGKGVFLNEMMEIAGVVNIFAGQDGWMPVEAESVAAANPDIIFTNVNYIDDPVAEILSRPGWENISAVKNGRVYYIDNSSTALPNHNIVKGMREMAEFAYSNKTDG